MNELPSDNLPPELDELGQRMSKERPVASDPALDRVMTRAQSARRPRKSLLWRSTAPRAGRRSIAALVAGVMAMAGVTGVAVLGASADDSVNPTALNSVVTPPPVVDCPDGTIAVDLEPLLCAVIIPEGDCPEGSVQVDLPPLTCIVVGTGTPGSGDGACPEGTVEVSLEPLLCATVVSDPGEVCPEGSVRVVLGDSLACVVLGVGGTPILGGDDTTGEIPIVTPLLQSLGIG